MKRLVLLVSLTWALTLCFAGTALAVSSPTISAILPASAPNDRDTAVVITGTGFAADGVTPPTATLGTTALTAVTFVNDTTLTATVPKGLVPGLYALTVTNPDTGSASLSDAFTATPPPTVTAIDPAAAYNDLDAPATITGTGFATAAGGTVVPTVTLGTTPLTDVAFVSATTLTATVPWGMDTGTYELTVINPDGGTGSLAAAFTVEAGIGKWNSGDLFGGQIGQLVMKPGDPDTIYATAFGVIGLFRSTDAGEHWALVSDKAWANLNDVAVDPLHDTWLYVYAPNGLLRSQDEGETWTTLMPNSWPDGRDVVWPQVYVSPYSDASHPQALFVSSSLGYGEAAVGARGLTRSTDRGATWTIVPSLEGVAVQGVAFDPNDHSHVVLVTSDMKVYASVDWGSTWAPVATSGLTPSRLGPDGSITYNPGGTEVWIDSTEVTGGISDGGLFKSAATDLTDWKDVSQRPGQGSGCLAFTSASTVYIPRSYSTDGGTSWKPFGPSPWYGYGQVLFDPTDDDVCYIENDAVGVQKTTDGGATWQVKVEGLTGLRCTSVAVSRADPLRVYAACYGPLGIYCSVDGTSHWAFDPIPGAWQVRQTMVDPLDSQRLYVGADSGFYTSPDEGASWPGPGTWNLPPSSPSGLFVTMAADPFQAGHLLASFGGGTYGDGPGWLYSSTDYGTSWQSVDVNPGAGVLWIRCITFDPETPGTVYLATNGVYRSADSGATWQRIDDPQQPQMAKADDIVIATHPRHVLFVGAFYFGAPYRSLDGGATWQRTTDDWPGPSTFTFVDDDSTRLYAASWQGLYFSSDAGDSWRRAAGFIGRVQITALGYAKADGHTILYAATNGGTAGTSSTAGAAGSRRAAGAADTSVAAGVYRYVVVNPVMTLRLSGLRAGTLRLGHRVTARGVVTPASLAGVKVTVTVQRRHSGAWVRVRAVTRTIGVTGAYSWTYQPAKTGTYRLRVAMRKAATHTAASTTWRSFRVR